MRFAVGLLLPALCLLADGPAKPALEQVRTVYLLPMGSGLDQYLANRLNEKGLVQVVADPQKADAIFTETLGEGLEQKLNELFPGSSAAAQPEASEKDPFGKPPRRAGGFSRGRGTVFLIDRATRSVLWSVYQPVKSSSPADTNRRAGEIARRFEKSLKSK